MQHLEVSGAVRHIYIYIYIYVIRRLKVNSSCIKYEVEVIFGKCGSMMEKFAEMKSLFETRNIKTKTLLNIFKLYY